MKMSRNRIKIGPSHVMVNKLGLQTIVREFYSHWVPNTSSLVLQLSLVYKYITMIQFRFENVTVTATQRKIVIHGKIFVREMVLQSSNSYDNKFLMKIKAIFKTSSNPISNLIITIIVLIIANLHRKSGWVRWSSENCARSLNLTIRTNAICTTQNLSWRTRHTNSSGNLGYKRIT